MKIKILDDRLKELGYPKRGSLGACGIDLYACLKEVVMLYPGEQLQITSGIAIETGDGVAGLVIPRSQWGTRGLVLGNEIGLIDEDYRGPVLISALNRNHAGTRPLIIQPLERIAQLVAVPLVSPRKFEVVDELSETERGAQGFGHSGR